ncbi:hypothetical protein DFH08DRAFT_938783 [Mycena albidolilacea]|uniref:Hydrophobin n=1 Tax=Mycena albidolilacea TaxID=1033008 RepID=A0AAD7ENT2_9AGAR|nr:hypothetical protein DFH08DRAFT_938783 [Mycena albidolilacea]
MFHKSFSTLILAILAGALCTLQVHATALSTPCGGANPACPSGQICCPVLLMTPRAHNEPRVQMLQHDDKVFPGSPSAWQANMSYGAGLAARSVEIEVREGRSGFSGQSTT